MLTTSVDRLVYIGAPCVSRVVREFVRDLMAPRKLGRATLRPLISMLSLAQCRYIIIEKYGTDTACNYPDL